MTQRLSGKTAVVTGASRGLGESIARELAAAGAAVMVSGRNEVEGARVVAAIRAVGGTADWQRADMGSAEDCERLIDATVERFGALDILVNNAAHLGEFPYGSTTADEWDEVFAANTRGPFLCCRRAAEHMRARGQGGCIVNIGTTQSRCPNPDRMAYGCSKAALQAMTKGFARAYAKDRVRVNWVTVGWIATPRELEYRTRTHGDGAAFLAETGPRLPMGALQTPEDVAAAVVFLAGDEARYVTACELNVSGGLQI